LRRLCRAIFITGVRLVLIAVVLRLVLSWAALAVMILLAILGTAVLRTGLVDRMALIRRMLLIRTLRWALCLGFGPILSLALRGTVLIVTILIAAILRMILPVILIVLILTGVLVLRMGRN